MYDKQQWVDTFLELGIDKGMLVVLDGQLNEIELTINQANTFFDALISVLSSEGTIVCFSNNDYQIEPSQWDRDVAVSDYGRIRDNLVLSSNLLASHDSLKTTMLLRDDVLIKRHPLYNVMAIGKYARFVTRKIPLNFPSGTQSPMQASSDLKGYVLVLNDIESGSHPFAYALADQDQPIYVSGGVMIEHGVAYWQKFLNHKLDYQKLHQQFKALQVDAKSASLGRNKMWLMALDELVVDTP